MKDAHFVAVPFDANLIAAIRGTHKVDHWPHPVLLNGTTGAVIERNAWGKTDVDSFNNYLAALWYLKSVEDSMQKIINL